MVQNLLKLVGGGKEEGATNVTFRPRRMKRRLGVKKTMHTETKPNMTLQKKTRKRIKV